MGGSTTDHITNCMGRKGLKGPVCSTNKQSFCDEGVGFLVRHKKEGSYRRSLAREQSQETRDKIEIEDRGEVHSLFRNQEPGC